MTATIFPTRKAVVISVCLTKPKEGQLDTIDDKTRARIREEIKRSGKKDGEIAALAGMSDAKLSKILSGTKLNITVSELHSLAAALRIDPSSLLLVPSSVRVHDSVGSVPLISIRRVPMETAASEMAEKIKTGEHRMFALAVPLDDPKAFALELDSAEGGFDAGDVLVIAPSRAPEKGAPAAIRVGPRVMVGKYLELTGAPLVSVGSDLYSTFEMLGPVHSSTKRHLSH